jgi:AraC-like DNA-binding protein
MQPDALSDLLRLAEASCTISRGFTASGKWALRFPEPRRLKATAVLEGRCWLTTDNDHEPLALEAGDVAIFDGSHGFTLASERGLRAESATRRFADSPEAMLHVGDVAAPDVVSVGGHLDMNELGRILFLHTMPATFVIRSQQPEGKRLIVLLSQLRDELGEPSPGGYLAARELAQLVLVSVVRAHLATSVSFPPGALRGLGDPRIAPAISAIHADPARRWELAELARHVSMSRSTFAQHFRAVTGVPPLTYLSNWRIELAAHALRTGTDTVARIGHRYGYGSDSAFSAAFKRVKGVAPREFRDAGGMSR